MTPDRNKTLTTRQVTAAVVTWMDEHGFKPVETEVLVEESGWQADVAGLIDCTESEAVQLHLAPRKPSYRLPNEKYREKREAFERAYRGLPCPLTVLVEVKTALSDLRSDSKWTRAAPTDLCYVALPPNLLSSALTIVPATWGILLVSRDGVKAHRYGTLQPGITLEKRFRVAYNVAVRRDHRTRYKALRESLKAARVVHNRETVTPDRWNRIVLAVLDICDGGSYFRKEMSVEQILAWHRIGKLPPSLIERLKKELWCLRSGSTKADGEEIAA